MMENASSRKWIVLGVVLLGVVTLVMGWFAGRHIPADPLPTPQDTVSFALPSEIDTAVTAVEEIDVAQGERLQLNEVTQGHAFTSRGLIEYAAAEHPDEKHPYSDSAYLSFDFVPFELQAGETKVISAENFKEWYSSFPLIDTSSEPRYRGTPLPSKVFLVSVTAKNPSMEESVILPKLTLWSEDFNLVSGSMGAGAYPSVWALPMLYPGSQHSQEYVDGRGGPVVYGPSGSEWLTLAPGEEREIVFPYHVYQNSFANRDAFVAIDLAKFCVEVNAFDPGIRYKFWLG